MKTYINSNYSGFDMKQVIVVRSDLKLPKGDGLDLLAQIREKELPVPVVIITGQGDEDSVVAALRAGAYDYVIKQTDYLSRLPQVLHDAFNRYQTQNLRKDSPIFLLYAEHNTADIDLTRRHFKRHSPHILIDVVTLGSAVIEKLIKRDNNYNILLLDYRLPGMHALELLKELRQMHRLDIPVVLITGHGDEDIALQALKLGAYDYVVKAEGYLHRLPATIENALYYNRLVGEKARYLSLFESVPMGLYRSTPDGRCVEANSAMIKLLGYPDLAAIQATNLSDVYVDPADRQSLLELLEKSEVVIGFVTLLKCKDGSQIWVELDVRTIRNSKGETAYLQGTVKNISDRVEMYEELSKHRNHLEEMVAQRTTELQEKMDEQKTIMDLMAGREVRMAELKKVIRNLRIQLKDAGMEPVDDDPLNVSL